MTAINLYGKIDSLMVNYLLEKFISGKTKTIYLDTTGGEMPSAFKLIDFISKSYQSDKELTLVASGNIFSAGMWVFYLSMCKKRILPGTIGLAHKVGQLITVLSNGKGRNNDEYYRKRLEKVWLPLETRFLEMIELDKKETKKYNSGEDIRLEEARLKAMLAKSLKKLKLPPEDKQWYI